MAKKDFVEQLMALGYKTQEPDGGKVYFEYTVPIGKNAGKKIMLGFEVGEDFPMNCPTGPHILAVSDGWTEHSQNIHVSPFTNVVQGAWRYWSRPFKEWNRSKRTVRTYLAHFKNLMMSV